MRRAGNQGYPDQMVLEKPARTDLHPEGEKARHKRRVAQRHSLADGVLLSNRESGYPGVHGVYPPEREGSAMNDDRAKKYPQYESDESIRLERLVADQIAELWRCDFFKLPKSWEIDFAITREVEGKTRPQVVAWAEVKGRERYDWAFFERNGFMISTKKLAAAKNLMGVTNLPFICIVKVSDGIYWRRFKTANEMTEAEFFVSGRADARDPWEPVSNFDAKTFTKLVIP